MVTIPADDFGMDVSVGLTALRVVAFNRDCFGNRGARGVFVSPADWNPVTVERILLGVVLCILAGYNPVVTLSHATVLSQQISSHNGRKSHNTPTRE
jgi:hypothetical protein